MIGKLLGHTQVHTTARYSHLANDPAEVGGDIAFPARKQRSGPDYPHTEKGELSSFIMAQAPLVNLRMVGIVSEWG